MNLQFIRHSDSREKTSRSQGWSVSCQQLNNHISLFSSLLPPPPSLSSSPQSLRLNDPPSVQFCLSLPPSAKAPLSATVILINYLCWRVPVPGGPGWRASVRPRRSCRRESSFAGTSRRSEIFPTHQCGGASLYPRDGGRLTGWGT